VALKDYLAEAERCSQCSYCKWIPFDQVKSWKYSRGCPSIAYNNFVSYSARGRYNLTRALVDKTIAYSEKVKDIAFQCNTCGSCDITCKIGRFNLEPLEMIREMRAQLVTDGQTIPQHQVLINSLKKSGNMFQKPQADRGQWAKGLDIKNILNEKAKVLFHTGCRFSYDKDQQSVARAAVSLLAKSGIDIGIMGTAESCCGGRAYSIGFRDEFNRYARKNLETWEKAGVETIVTSCSDCYHTFKRLYPIMGSHFKVFHTVEYLDRLIKEGKIQFRKNIPLKVTYHDPCHLGRQGESYIPWQGKEKKILNQIVSYEPRKPRYNGARGIYDPPRNVIRSIPGIELVEMERIREYAWCCGAGGGVKEAYPEFSNWTATERIEEAKSTGAEAIVSACGWCERNFLDSIDSKGEKMRVFDIAELVERAI
jgi:Fe-S oxidoreductase